jgi:hypothetical protein
MKQESLTSSPELSARCPECGVFRDYLGYTSHFAGCTFGVPNRAAVAPPPPAEPALPKLTDEQRAFDVARVNGNPIFMDFTDHDGERSILTVEPRDLQWMGTAEFPEPQWVLVAFDLEAKALRNFPLRNINRYNGDKTEHAFVRAIEQELRPPAPDLETHEPEPLPPEDKAIYNGIASRYAAAPSGPPVAERTWTALDRTLTEADVRSLLTALASQTQLDADGVMVGMSREAVDHAASLIERHILGTASREPLVEAPSAEVWGVVHRETGRIDMVSEDEAGATYCYTEGYEKRKGIAYFPPSIAGIASTRRGEHGKA